MGFAPGRGRAAPSDDLPGQVSCWLWEGPFTLGAVWPPRFLPPLPFHPLLSACQASTQHCELPEPGAGSPWGRLKPGQLLSCSSTIMWTLGGDQESLGPQSQLLQKSLLSGPEVHSWVFLFGMIPEDFIFRSEVGRDFPAINVPYITKYLLLTCDSKSWEMCVASSPNIFSLISKHFFLFIMILIYLFTFKILPTTRGYEASLVEVWGEDSAGGIWVGSSEVLRTRSMLPALMLPLPAPCFLPLVHRILN